MKTVPSIRETEMVSERINNKNDIDLDLFEHGFDGIFRKGAEQIGRQETMDRIKKTNNDKFGIRPDTYIDRDVYGRGDRRIFGSAAIIRSGTESKEPTEERRRRRVFVVPACVMGNLKKYSRAARRAEKDDDILIPLETVSSGEENVNAADSTIENAADNSSLKSTKKDALETKDIEDDNAEFINEAGEDTRHINEESSTAAEDNSKIAAQGREFRMIGSFERYKSFSPRLPMRASIGMKSAKDTPQKSDASNEQPGDQMPTALHATPVTPALESTSSPSASSSSGGLHNEPTTASKSTSEKGPSSSGPSSPHHDNVIKKTRKNKSTLKYASSHDGPVNRIASKDKTNNSSPNTSNCANSNILRRLRIRDCFSSSEHSDQETAKSAHKYSSKSATPKASSTPTPSSCIARFIERRKGIMEKARRLFMSSSIGDDKTAKNTGSSTRGGSTAVREIKSAPLVVRKYTGNQTDPNINTNKHIDNTPLPENNTNETTTAEPPPPPPPSSSSSTKMPPQKTEYETFNTSDFVTANQTVDFGNNVSQQTNKEQVLKESTSSSSSINGVSSHSNGSGSVEIVPVIDATISYCALQPRTRSQSGHSNTGVSSTKASEFECENIVADKSSQISSPISAFDFVNMETQEQSAESTLVYNEIYTAPVPDTPQHKPLRPSQRVPQWGSSSFHAMMVQQIIALDEIEWRRSIEQQNSMI